MQMRIQKIACYALSSGPGRQCEGASADRETILVRRHGELEFHGQKYQVTWASGWSESSGEEQGS